MVTKKAKTSSALEAALSSMVGKKVKRKVGTKTATQSTKAAIVKQTKAKAKPVEAELVPDVQLSDHTGLIVGGAKSKGKKCIMLTRLYCTQRDPQWKYARGGMMIPRTELKGLLARIKEVATDPNTEYKDMDQE